MRRRQSEGSDHPTSDAAFEDYDVRTLDAGLACARSILMIAGRSRTWIVAMVCAVACLAATRAAAQTLAEATRALAAGDGARAFDLGTAWLKQHPTDVRARVLLARIHLGRDELDAAYRQLEQALRAQPRDVDALYYLGLVTGQLAARQLEGLVERAPASARAHQLLAESLEAQERRTEAEAAYEAALRAKPDLLDALLGLAKLLRIRLECTRAIELYTRAEAVRPSFDGAYGLGSCYLRQQQLDAALPRFEQAVKRDPRAAIARVGLASTLLASDRTAEAIAALRRAVALEPAMSEAWYLLGRALQTAGDRVAAKDAFARAEALRTGATPSPPREEFP
jgi:tetratricopeptide (TPR) repeat protein